MLNGQGIEGFESSRRSRFGEPGMATPACAAPERDRLEAAGYRDRARCDGRCGEPMDVGGARWWRGSIAFAHDARPSFQIDAGAEALDSRFLVAWCGSLRIPRRGLDLRPAGQGAGMGIGHFVLQ